MKLLLLEVVLALNLTLILVNVLLMVDKKGKVRPINALIAALNLSAIVLFVMLHS